METQGFHASALMPAVTSTTSPAARGAPSGAAVAPDTPTAQGPTPVLLLQPLGGLVLPSGWAWRGRGHWREAAGVPREPHPRPRSAASPATLPLQSRGWAPSPHSPDLACPATSLRHLGAVHPPTSMHTLALHPARASVGARHPCFQRSALCSYTAPAVYTGKETGRCNPDLRAWPAQDEGHVAHTSG